MKETQILRGLQKAKAAHYANGMVPTVGKGNVVYGPGTETSDSIDAKISTNEAVLPANTVEAIGPNNLARLIEETNGMAPNRGLTGKARFADGMVPEENLLGKAKRGLGAVKDSLFPPKAGTTPMAPTPKPTDPIAATRTASVSRTGVDAVNAGSRLRPAAPTAPAATAPTSTFGKLRAGAGAVARAIPAAAGIGAAVKGFNTDTSEYQDRTGIENPLGARAVGVLGDVGDLVTGGIAPRIGRYFADVINGSDETPAQPAAVAAQPAAPATGAASPAAAAEAPIAAQPPRPTQTRMTLAQAQNAQNIARNGGGEPIARGTGFIVSNNDGEGQDGVPSGVNIDTRPQPSGLRAAATPADPYSEANRMMVDADRLESDGTFDSQLEAGRLRNRAKFLADTVKANQGELTQRAGQKTNSALEAQLKLAENSRQERSADQQAATEFQKRLERFIPDEGSGENKIDNSAKRADLQQTLADTLYNLPPEEQAKLRNPATGEFRGVEALDPKLAERLMFNYKVRDRVRQSGGFFNGLAGNRTGQDSNNLLDYDLENASVIGDMVVFPNGARVNKSDLQYLEGPANPLLPDWFKTDTNNFNNRLRGGARGGN
jgi:hypothetical protein